MALLAVVGPGRDPRLGWLQLFWFSRRGRRTNKTRRDGAGSGRADFAALSGETGRGGKQAGNELYSVEWESVGTSKKNDQ